MNERSLACGTFTIETFGRVYRSNGPTYGSKGKMIGVPAQFVRNHLTQAALRGEDCNVTDDQTGKVVPSGQVWRMDIFKQDNRTND